MKINLNIALKSIAVIILTLLLTGVRSAAAPKNKLSIRGNLIFMNGKPFDMWGIRVASASENDNSMDHLIAQLDDYKKHGVNSIAVYLMGSRGGAWDPFTEDGSEIDKDQLRRMKKIIKESDKRGMAVIVGIFYQRVSSEKIRLKDWESARRAVVSVAAWTKKLKHKNIILNIANEQNSSAYENVPWKKVREPESIIELCVIAKQTNPDLIVGAGGYDMEKNKIIGTSDAVDILLFDTSTPEKSSEFLYQVYKSAGVEIPMVNVEMFGGWTARFKDGIFQTDPDIRHYYDEVDAVVKTDGLYTFFFASDWSQSGASGKANRYDLAGMGTKEDPGIRWYFEYLSRKLNLK